MNCFSLTAKGQNRTDIQKTKARNQLDMDPGNVRRFFLSQKTDEYASGELRDNSNQQSVGANFKVYCRRAIWTDSSLERPNMLGLGAYSVAFSLQSKPPKFRVGQQRGRSSALFRKIKPQMAARTPCPRVHRTLNPK